MEENEYILLVSENSGPFQEDTISNIIDRYKIKGDDIIKSIETGNEVVTEDGKSLTFDEAF